MSTSAPGGRQPPTILSALALDPGPNLTLKLTIVSEVALSIFAGYLRRFLKFSKTTNLAFQPAQRKMVVLSWLAVPTPRSTNSTDFHNVTAESRICTIYSAEYSVSTQNIVAYVFIALLSLMIIGFSLLRFLLVEPNQTAQGYICQSNIDRKDSEMLHHV